MNIKRILCSIGAGFALAGAVAGHAEVTELRIAQQFGLGYLPLTVMEQDKLIEKHAAAAGIPNLKVSWQKIASGQQMNEALLAGRLDVASGGLAPFILVWSQTRNSAEVKGIAALNVAPVYLNTRNPSVKSIRDFGDSDRIAMPAVKTSYQAVVLQMAASQAFGDGGFDRLDALTVSMAHPDGHARMLSEKSDITAHFSASPFQYQQLQKNGIRRVLSSYDVLNGVATFNLAWTTTKFQKENPKVYGAVFEALRESTERIRNGHLEDVAKIYIAASKDRMSVKEVTDQLLDPYTQYTVRPKNTYRFSSFMYRVGHIRNRPESWRDLFFPSAHELAGS